MAKNGREKSEYDWWQIYETQKAKFKVLQDRLASRQSSDPAAQAEVQALTDSNAELATNSHRLELELENKEAALHEKDCENSAFE